MLYYALFYVVGLVAGYFSPTESMRAVLRDLEPITLTALIATLPLPFAAFAKNEGWQKFCLKYPVTSLFGIYTVLLERTASVGGLVLLIVASAPHFASWMASVHSRQYRLDQFKLGFAKALTETSQLVAMLNGQGKSDEADAIVSCILCNKPVDWLMIERALANNQPLLEGIKEEIGADGMI